MFCKVKRQISNILITEFGLFCPLVQKKSDIKFSFISGSLSYNWLTECFIIIMIRNSTLFRSYHTAMTKLEKDFLEEYKRTDNMIKGAYSCQNGVSEYISMMEKSPGNRAALISS